MNAERLLFAVDRFAVVILNGKPYTPTSGEVVGLYGNKPAAFEAAAEIARVVDDPVRVMYVRGEVQQSEDDRERQP